MLRFYSVVVAVAFRCVSPADKREGDILKITELAAEMGLTAQAIRNKCQRAGYSLESLREPGSKELSNEGITIIMDLFGRSPAKGKKKTTAAGKEKKRETLALVKSERDQLQIRAAAAEAVAAERQRTIDDLREQIRRQDENIKALLAKQVEPVALPEPEKVKNGWFARFRSKLRKM